MDFVKKSRKARNLSATSESASTRMGAVRFGADPDESACLDSLQLDRLEQSFRVWAGESSRLEAQVSRQRILLIFLLIRYTGAKLNEVLALDSLQDLDFARHAVRLGRPDAGMSRTVREVPLPEALVREIQVAFSTLSCKASPGKMFTVDPGFVRRKFYERAEACGFPKRLGAPEMIRKARAVELVLNNMPLPAVQMLLGHSTPNLTTAHVSFSADEVHQVTRHFMDREATRKTSARNTFIGKIQEIARGDIQSRVALVTIGGHRVTTVITNDSLVRLGLREGRLITAEVKAPWVLLHRISEEPRSSADNRFYGTVCRITEGKVTTEYVVRTDDGIELCAVVTSESGRRLDIKEQDPVWAAFNSFSVVLREE